MKQKTVGFRVDADLKSRFEEIAQQTGVDASTIGRELIRAVVEHAESYGELSFPIAIRSGSRAYPMVAEGEAQGDFETKDGADKTPKA
jgi:antitoxin component of RelBE/YafQ-DinJ toxin-antitoxin module